MTKTDAGRLSQVRDKIAALTDEAEDLERRPVSRDEAISAADRWIAKQAQTFAPGVRNLVNKGEAWTELGETRSGGVLDFTPALCAIAGDRVREALVSRIDAALADAAPIGTEERNTRRQEIDREKLTLEREEEDLVKRFQAAGQHVERRGDADPRAILGLTSAPKRPALPAEAEERTPIAQGPSKSPLGDVICAWGCWSPSACNAAAAGLLLPAVAATPENRRKLPKIAARRGPWGLGKRYG